MTLAALGLAAGYLVVAVGDPLGWVAIEPAGVLCGLHAIVVMGLWWLGAGHSPLRRLLPPALDYYPIVTAIAALSAIQIARQFAAVADAQDASWLGSVRTEGSRRTLAFQACLLAILALAFTAGRLSGITAATAFLASLAMAMAALMSGWGLAAGLASMVSTGAWSILGAVLARGWACSRSISKRPGPRGEP